MKYPIDINTNISKSLLFWLERFVRNKLTSLSNRNINNQEKFTLILQQLIIGGNDIEGLKDLSKDARNIGLSGISTYFNPLYKLYNYISTLNLNSLKEIDEEMLSDFLAINTSNLSDASKKNHRIALLSFFGYIDKQNILNENDNNYSNIGYLYNIELKNWGGLSGRSGTKLPSFMNKSEIEKFIYELSHYGFTDKIKARNRLIIKIILYTGVRVSEAINLLKKDLFYEEGIYLLQIKGKGNKPRVVMIKASIIQKDLEEWLGLCHCQDTLLICNNKGLKLTQSYISRIVEKILLSAGIRKEKNGAHMLRHSFATLLYSKHHDLVLVQEALGHADINTSRIYTHFDTSRLIKTTDLM
jgi:integrase/recombinase XerD